MRLLAMLTVAGWALTAAAQDFQLRTATGELTGPFRFHEGEAVQVGTNTANIVNIRSQENEILDKMQAIRIPEIDFRQANLRDVVAFLTDASVKFSPDQRGISMILKLDEQHPSVPDTSADFFEATTNSVPDSASTIPTVTFSALDITLKEALDYSCDIAGYKYRIRGGAVMIMPRNAPDGPIVDRTYDIPPTSISRIKELGSALRGKQQGDFMEIKSGNGQNQQDESENDLKLFFAEMGVPWPTGSYIKYLRELGKLAVGNTEENLAIFEKVMGIHDVLFSQIEIELAFLSCDRHHISRLGPDGVTSAALMTLWTSGEAELMAAPRVVTQSGQAATVKGCTEYIYPTELTVCSTATTNTNHTATAYLITPSDFETRDVGIILEVLPEISPEGNLFNISLSPEFVEPPEWTQFNGTFVGADGKTNPASLPQPYFHTYKETSNVLVANGKRVLIGGGLPSRDGQRLIYMLLTARKVGTDGEPLR